VTTEERLYSRLLLAYPPAFRREYGDQLIETFRDLRRDASGTVLTFWLFIVSDVIRSAARQRVGDLWLITKRPEVEWVVMSLTGAIAIAVMAQALPWSVSYLYHPYLEGMSIPPWLCGAVLGLSLGVVQNAVQDAVQSGKAGRGRARRARLILTTVVASALGLQIAVMFGRPAVYGTVLGAFVSGAQWLVFSRRTNQAGAWILSSLTAMSVAVATSAGAIGVTLRGLDPRALDPQRVDLPNLVSLVFAQAISMSLPSIVVMMGCGFLSAALTTRLLSAMHAKGRPC
jgi:hypothetical protein